MDLFFASHEITIYRYRRKGSSDRYGMSATLTAYPADIQPASIERVEAMGGSIGNIFTVFLLDSVDIKEGDHFTSDGKRYAVRGISRYEDAGIGLDHKEITAEKTDG